MRERLEWNYAQAKKRNFADRMIDEVYRKGCLALRIHPSGDVFSPSYARAWIKIVEASTHCRFWLYSRSHRIPAIEQELRKLAVLPNCVVYYSADSETKLPAEVPDQVRVAWMQVEEGDQPDEGFDLAFLDKPLRKRVPLALAPTVCPQETPAGKARGITCAVCSTCFTK